MAITTYTELQTAVADWLNRSDLSSKVPDFIALTEADVNRRLRCRQMEAEYTGNLTAGTANYGLSSLASDLAAIRQVNVTSGGYTYVMNYISMQQYIQRHPAGSGTGLPTDYTVVGNTLKFGPVPDSDYGWSLWYYRTIPALSSSNTTNWLLTRHPDVYLYGSLVAATPYIEDDPRLQTWGSLYENALAAVMLEGHMSKLGGTARQTSEMGTP